MESRTENARGLHQMTIHELMFIMLGLAMCGELARRMASEMFREKGNGKI